MSTSLSPSPVPPNRRKAARPAFVAAAAAAVLFLAACGGGSDANPSSSNSGTGGGSADTKPVNVVTPAQPESLDPQISTEAISGEITGTIYESLLTVDKDHKVQPQLAASYERSTDGKTFTFVLREGVKFHDGSTMTADDVVASMNRWNAVSIAAEEAFKGASWSKVDEKTVKLTVPSASFLHELYLSSLTTAYPAIMPKAIAEKASTEPVKDIIGTGPYKLATWDADQKIVVDAFADYSALKDQPRSGKAGDKTPTISEVVFSFSADPATRTMGIQSGQYDLTPEMPFDALASVKEDPNLQIGTYFVSPINLVYSDRKGGPFEKVINRQAINTAVDREPIMMASVGSPDLFQLSHTNMVKAKEDVWKTDVGLADFNKPDPEKAKAMLKEGGYNGEEVTLLVTKDYTEAYNAAVVLESQLKNIGVNVKLEALEWASYFEKYKEGRDSWDLTIIPQGNEVDPTQTVGFLPNRAGYYDTPELQTLLKDFRGAPTQADGQKMFDKMQEYIEKYRPLTRLGDADNVYVATKKLSPLPVFDSTILWWDVTWAQ